MLRLYCCLILLAATAHAQQQQHPIALTGTLVTPDEVIPNGTILIEHGRIRDLGPHIAIPPDAITVDTHGIIAPGLIDLHNHLTWNVFPRWKPIEEFNSRYDWQARPIYSLLMVAPHKALVDEGLECDAERYAEVKAITQGETSLDDDPELGPNNPPKIVYNVFPFQMTEPDLAAAKQSLAAHGALLIHVAEGAPNSASAAREFEMLKGRGLLLPGVSLIHGVALKPENFAEMKSAGVGFVWSPRSNIELYGGTANIAAALQNGVTTALAPDWSPTGSDGVLGELQYAATWNAAQTTPLLTDHQLFDMATINPAALVHLDHQLGRLEKNYAADILVLRPHTRQPANNPWWNLDHASPDDVELVLIGGEPVYGDPAPMQKLLPNAPLESLTICGAQKRFSFATEPQPQPPFAETESRLNTALREWGRHLAPLAECGQ